jgi:hypothetical protein
MSIKTLLLVGALSLAAVPAAQATERPPPGIGNGHASAAPTCGYECPMLADDGPPGTAGDKNGRSMTSATARSGHGGPGSPGPGSPGDGGPGSPGDHNGRSSAALSQGGGEYRVAASRPSAGGDINL